jgi:hypothetical protein
MMTSILLVGILVAGTIAVTTTNYGFTLTVAQMDNATSAATGGGGNMTAGNMTAGGNTTAGAANMTDLNSTQPGKISGCGVEC